jgi:RNA polymerase sigma-70 factor, ECF subfamily
VGRKELFMGSQDTNHDLLTKEFVHLLQKQERQLSGFVLSLVPNVADADQIVQDISLILWQRFNEFDRNTNFGAWARTIAYYQVRRYRKKAARNRVCFNSKLLDVLADRVAVRLDNLDARQTAVIDCVNKLPEIHRQFISLYYYSGMSIRVAAEKLGRSVAAAEKAIVRIRRALFNCVEATLRREEQS